MKKTLTELLSDFDKQTADHLALLLTKDFKGVIYAQDFIHLQQLSQLSPSALKAKLLPFAVQYSHAPISNFWVGAIATGISGNLYFGANLEFSQMNLQQSVHAEQSAIANAWMNNERQLTEITINYAPCGHCRQFIQELTEANKMIIHLPNKAPRAFNDFLPEAFGPTDLGISTLLLSEQNHNESIKSTDPLMKKALKGLNMSYSPYSQSYAGLAIELKDGHQFMGSYAENAAFNPSLSPFQVALTQLIFSGKTFSQISKVALIEKKNAQVKQADATLSLLTSLNPTASFNKIEID